MALLALDIHMPKPGQWLVDELLHSLRQTWGRSSPASLRLELAWIKGHSEAQGNSKVDEEAKADAEGNISLDQDLPDIFQVEAHPMSSSVMWQAQAAELKACWYMRWMDALRQTLKDQPNDAIKQVPAAHCRV